MVSLLRVLLAALHLCTQDEFNLNSMLPWHSLALNQCQVLVSSCTSVSASVPPILPHLKDLSLLFQESSPNTCALFLRNVCFLTSSRSLSSSCGCVQSVLIAYPCFPRPRFELGHTSRVPQVSAKRARPPRPNVVNIGPSTPSLSSPKFVASAALLCPDFLSGRSSPVTMTASQNLFSLPARALFG